MSEPIKNLLEGGWRLTDIISVVTLAAVIGLWAGGIGPMQSKLEQQIDAMEEQFLIWQEHLEDKIAGNREQEESNHQRQMTLLNKLDARVGANGRYIHHINNFITRKYPLDYRSIQ